MLLHAGNTFAQRFEPWIAAQRIEKRIDFDKIKFRNQFARVRLFPANPAPDLSLRARDGPGQKL